MKSSTEIFEELNNISPVLAGIEIKNIFSVPHGYFDELSVKTLKTIFTEFTTSKLAVPEGYFETLSSSVLNKIKLLQQDAAEELRTLSPMLYSIQNENVFEVPSGYFKNLPNAILNKSVPSSQAKVVAFKKRNFVWKYAVAAAMTGIIGISSLLVFNKTQQPADQVNNLNVQAASQYKTEQQINEGISKLSDEEIIKYLEKNTNDADNETLTTNIEEKELPAQNDYLQDGQTLDTYLDNIDAKESKN